MFRRPLHLFRAEFLEEEELLPELLGSEEGTGDAPRGNLASVTRQGSAVRLGDLVSRLEDLRERLKERVGSGLVDPGACQFGGISRCGSGWRRGVLSYRGRPHRKSEEPMTRTQQ